jgi:IclR family transcriptional regulator, mhp operon transcriptional activator
MIRSLSRGLEILTLLNRRDSASAGECAKELGIPRATVYRILDTLREKGLVRQHESDQRYRITPKVRTLSDGFTDEDHIAHISRRFLKRITKKLNWPVALATISGVDLIVRENTDQMSPLAIENFSSGYRMPILHTASGICILANMQSSRRKVILDTLEEMNRIQDQVVHQRDSLERKMQEVRSRGFAVHHRRRKHSDLTAISVPIIPAEGEVRGAVTIRYARTAMKLPSAIQAFVPVLNEAADGIAECIKLHLDKQARNARRRASDQNGYK